MDKPYASSHSFLVVISLICSTVSCNELAVARTHYFTPLLDQPGKPWKVLDRGKHTSRRTPVSGEGMNCAFERTAVTFSYIVQGTSLAQRDRQQASYQKNCLQVSDKSDLLLYNL